MSQQLKPHFLAICKAQDGTYFLSNTFYHDPMKARVELGSVYVRLANELGPVLLEPAKTPATRPVEVAHGRKKTK